jgi:hypothetical protein
MSRLLLLPTDSRYCECSASARGRFFAIGSAALADVYRAFSLDENAATKWQHARQEPVARIQTRDLREDALRASRHPPGGNVVFGAVPRTDQATVAVDRSVREIGTEMPASASHREQLTVRVSYRIPSGTADNPGHQLGGRPNFDLSCHRPSHGSLAFTVGDANACQDDASVEIRA